MSLFSNAGFPDNILKRVKDALATLQSNINTLSASNDKKTVYSDFAITTHASGTLNNGHGGYATKQMTITKSGYYPLGIIGIQSVSTNHYNNTPMGPCVDELRLLSRANGSGVLYGRTYVADNQEWTYTSSFTAHVLWVRVR